MDRKHEMLDEGLGLEKYLRSMSKWKNDLSGGTTHKLPFGEGLLDCLQAFINSSPLYINIIGLFTIMFDSNNIFSEDNGPASY